MGIEELFVLLDCVTVGHAGQVIAHGARQPALGDQRLEIVRQHGGRIGVSHEDISEDLLRLGVHAHHAGMIVEILEEEIFQLAVAALHLVAVADHVVVQLLDVECGLGFARLDAGVGGFDDIGDQNADQAADKAMAGEIVEVVAIPADAFEQQLPELEVGAVGRGDHAGAQAVIKVVGGVGQFVGGVGDLRFQVAAQLGVEGFCVGDVVLSFVLDDTFANLPGEVEAGEVGIALFELGDDAQRLAIVIEAAMLAHQRVERGLAGMAEGGVAKIVCQADDLDEVFIGAQGTGYSASDLGDLEGVGEPRAEVIALEVDEDLGLIFKPAEGRGVQHAVTVSLEASAVVGLPVGVGAALAVAAAHAIGRQHLVFVRFELFASEHIS